MAWESVKAAFIHCPYRVIRRDYMPYLENVVPEMDLVIADRGEDVQIRTPAGEVLAEGPWKELTEAPFIKINSARSTNEQIFKAE